MGLRADSAGLAGLGWLDSAGWSGWAALAGLFSFMIVTQEITSVQHIGHDEMYTDLRTSHHALPAGQM